MLLKYRVIDNKKEEMLDIVDEHDHVVGQENRETYRDQAFNPQGKYVRIVNCFIVNKEHKIWTPIRSPNKRSFPNAIDFSCGGYVQAGETYQEAIISEIEEENNLTVKPEDLVFLGKLTPTDDQVNVFMGVYKYVTNGPIDFNPKDFTSAQWLTKEELIAKIQGGFPCKNHLLSTLLKYQDVL